MTSAVAIDYSWSLYSEGSLILVKYQWYPWWPALVSFQDIHAPPPNRTDDVVLVKFVGERSFAWLPPHQVKPWDSSLLDEQRVKPGYEEELNKSIRLARDMIRKNPAIIDPAVITEAMPIGVCHEEVGCWGLALPAREGESVPLVIKRRSIIRLGNQVCMSIEKIWKRGSTLDVEAYPAVKRGNVFYVTRDYIHYIDPEEIEIGFLQGPDYDRIIYRKKTQ